MLEADHSVVKEAGLLLQSCMERAMSLLGMVFKKFIMIVMSKQKAYRFTGAILPSITIYLLRLLQFLCLSRSKLGKHGDLWNLLILIVSF